ncbi:MAG TPA: hypothetical protein VF894_10615 [Anaeromyxobacter sp.]
MKTPTLFALLVVPALLLGGCVTTTTRSTMWGDPYAAGWARYGRVESVRETVQTQQGDPGAGAVAGAIIGGILFGGRSPAHTMAGAIGGAMVGAAASQGQGEERIYDVFVRFDDGALETFVYRNILPFRIGDGVALTAQGLSRQ